MSRVTQKIPKLPKHFLTSACIVDFVNVFREDNDKEKDRKQPTPCPEKMLGNLKDFVQKWKEMKHGEDEDVLTTRVLHEVECLKKHIEKGCLSGIPPGAGSERNENLHKNLRTVIARSRLGVESAIALLATFFYVWNEQRLQLYPKGVVAPITSYADHLKDTCYQPTTECFGVQRKALTSQARGNILQFLSANTDLVQIHRNIKYDSIVMYWKRFYQKD